MVLSGEILGKPTGMDFHSVTAAACISAALATAIMALYARYPIAQAPGMGENFFFVLSAIPAAQAAGFGNPWQLALGTVFISGVNFSHPVGGRPARADLQCGKSQPEKRNCIGNWLREVGWLAYLLAVVLAAYFLFLRSRMG
jgi:xanthine/uracil/vitamin C permease (AzgA family)